jgi:hypothetical protein
MTKKISAPCGSSSRRSSDLIVAPERSGSVRSRLMAMTLIGSKAAHQKPGETSSYAEPPADDRTSPPGFNARTTTRIRRRSLLRRRRHGLLLQLRRSSALSQTPGEAPSPITSTEKMRYADGVIDHHRKLIYCVREDHAQAARPSTLCEDQPRRRYLWRGYRFRE